MTSSSASALTAVSAINAAQLAQLVESQHTKISTQRVFEVFVFVGVVYFVICFTLSRLFARLEQRAASAYR